MLARYSTLADGLAVDSLLGRFRRKKNKKKNVYLLELFEPEVLFDPLWATNVMSSNCNPGTMMSTRSMLLRIVVESRVLLYGAKKLSLK